MTGIVKKQGVFYELNSSISKAQRTLKEISNLNQEAVKTPDKEEKKLIENQIQNLNDSFKETVENLGKIIEKLSLIAPDKKTGIERPVFRPLSRNILTPAITSKSKKHLIKLKPLPSQTEKEIKDKEKEIDIFEKKEIEDVEKETLKR